MDENIGDEVGIVWNQVTGVGTEGRDKAIGTDRGSQAAGIAFLTRAALTDPGRCARLAITDEDVFIGQEAPAGTSGETKLAESDGRLRTGRQHSRWGPRCVRLPAVHRY